MNSVISSGNITEFVLNYYDTDNDVANIIPLVNDVDFRDQSIPDYIPTLIIDNATVIGPLGNFDFKIFVGDYASNKSQKNKPIKIVISVSSNLNLNFDNTILNFNGDNVNNVDWIYTQTQFSHIFEFVGNNSVFPANGGSIIGVSAIFSSPGSSSGTSLLKVSVQYQSGGEINNTNNDDFDSIYYLND